MLLRKLKNPSENHKSIPSTTPTVVYRAAGHAGPPDVFLPPVSREFRREPSGGFPARFGGHFVSSPRAISFQMTVGKNFLNGYNRLSAAQI